MRLLLVALSAVSIACAPLAAMAETQLIAPIHAQDTDIRVFIQEVARLTDLTVIVDERVRGTVSVTAEAPMSREEMLRLFVATLRASGVAAIPSVGGAFRIVPIESSVQRSSLVMGPGGALGAVDL
jgi:general secretion pathway protein D